MIEVIRKSKAKRCSYCHDDFLNGVATWTCPDCGAALHSVCSENRCSICLKPKLIDRYGEVIPPDIRFKTKEELKNEIIQLREKLSEIETAPLRAKIRLNKHRPVSMLEIFTFLLALNIVVTLIVAAVTTMKG